jgi:hypothetical protein
MDDVGEAVDVFLLYDDHAGLSQRLMGGRFGVWVEWTSVLSLFSSGYPIIISDRTPYQS